jgi:hypothetical protein
LTRIRSDEEGRQNSGLAAWREPQTGITTPGRGVAE